MKRVDFSTHPMYVPVCMDDAVVCKRFFGHLLAMKPLSVASSVIWRIFLRFSGIAKLR